MGMAYTTFFIFPEAAGVGMGRLPEYCCIVFFAMQALGRLAGIFYDADRDCRARAGGSSSGGSAECRKVFVDGGYGTEITLEI